MRTKPRMNSACTRTRARVVVDVACWKLLEGPSYTTPMPPTPTPSDRKDENYGGSPADDRPSESRNSERADLAEGILGSLLRRIRGSEGHAPTHKGGILFMTKIEE